MSLDQSLYYTYTGHTITCRTRSLNTCSLTSKKSSDSRDAYSSRIISPRLSEMCHRYLSRLDDLRISMAGETVRWSFREDKSYLPVLMNWFRTLFLLEAHISLPNGIPKHFNKIFMYTCFIIDLSAMSIM